MVCRIICIVFFCFSCQVASFDPFSGTANKIFDMINPGIVSGSGGDSHVQVINGKVVIADFHAGIVSLLSLSDRIVVGSLKLPEMVSGAIGMAMLNDESIVVGGESKKKATIFIVDVSGDEPVIARNVSTSAELDNGVTAAGPQNKMALVTNNGHVRVMSLEDGTVETLAESLEFSVRQSATLHGDNLYISNWFGLDIVNINNGGRTNDIGSLALTDLSSMSLGQIAFDQAGNMYATALGEMCAANADPPCVLVISPEGRWRKLTDGPGSSEPKGIAVTSSGFVVTWLETDPSIKSTLEVYDIL